MHGEPASPDEGFGFDRDSSPSFNIRLGSARESPGSFTPSAPLHSVGPSPFPAFDPPTPKPDGASSPRLDPLPPWSSPDASGFC